MASVLELVEGNVCPVAFGSVPMCYVTLVLNAVIGMLYRVQLNPASNPRMN